MEVTCGIIRTYISVIRWEDAVAKRRGDPKVAALQAERSLNPRPDDVQDPSFAASEFFDPRDLVQVKYEMVRQVRVDGQPVSRSAAAFGFSRPSFYQAAAAVDAAGLAGSGPGPARASAGAQAHRRGGRVRPAGPGG